MTAATTGHDLQRQLRIILLLLLLLLLLAAPESSLSAKYNNLPRSPHAKNTLAEVLYVS